MNNEVRHAVVEMLGRMNYDVEGVVPETVLGPAGLDLESLAVAELSLWVQDEYGVKFAEDEMERFATMTIAELAEEIDKRRVAAVPARQSP
jgi:acyl carrier protein